MPVSGPPVVIVESGGAPVRPVDSGYPLLTVSENGIGAPITISDRGAPFIVQGYEPIEALSALSDDAGGILASDDGEVLETF